MVEIVNENIASNELKIVLERKLQGSIFNLKQVKSLPTHEVWKFSFHDVLYFIRISKEHISFYSEKWSLEHAQAKGAKVPHVFALDDGKNALDAPFIILYALDGNALLQIDSLTSYEKELALFEAGKDLAKINTIHTRQFGWCDTNQSIENAALTGFDDSMEATFSIALNESLPFLLENGYISQSSLNLLSDYIRKSKDLYQLKQGVLAHGDFTVGHIFTNGSSYSGIIDFGARMSTDPVWDLAHFSIENMIETHYLLLGWVEQMRGESFIQDYSFSIQYTHLIPRITFYRLVIALIKILWIIDHKDPKKPLYLKAIDESILLLQAS